MEKNTEKKYYIPTMKLFWGVVAYSIGLLPFLDLFCFDTENGLIYSGSGWSVLVGGLAACPVILILGTVCSVVLLEEKSALYQQNDTIKLQVSLLDSISVTAGVMTFGALYRLWQWSDILCFRYTAIVVLLITSSSLCLRKNTRSEEEVRRYLNLEPDAKSEAFFVLQGIGTLTYMLLLVICIHYLFTEVIYFVL